MRLPSLIAFAGLLLFAAGVFSKPLHALYEQTDVSALADRAEAEVHDARARLERTAKALKDAQSGLSCLDGSGPCPGGERNPFGR